MNHPIVPELAGYTFVEPLGKGGYGTVWLAVEEKTQAKVAVKVMRKGQGPARKELDAVIQVNSMIAAGFSERLVRVYGLAEDDRHLYLVMEWMDQGTLKSLIPGVRNDADPIKKGLPAGDACRYAISILEALQLLHQHNLCHRDLKPSNIFIADAQSHRVKIGDYSIVAIRNAESPGGTAPYVPEQTPGDPPERDHRADIYAVGAILFELIFAVNPQYSVEWLYKDREESRRPLPEPIRRIIEKATHPDPDKRYQSAAEMTADLRKVPEQPPQGRRIPTIAAIAILCAAIAASLLWIFRSRDAGEIVDTTPPSSDGKRLIAHWTFDENDGTTAADSSGHDRHFAVHGATWTGGALAFDGVDDYVAVGDFGPFDTFSVGFWIRMTSPAGGVVVNRDVAGSGEHDWWIGAGNGKVEFGVGVEGGNHMINTRRILDDDQWHFVVATRDNGTGLLALFVDGAPDVSDVKPAGSVSAAKTITIGRWNNGHEGYWGGYLDDVRIYNYVRSTSEVAAEYHAGHSLFLEGFEPNGAYQPPAGWTFHSAWGDVGDRIRIVDNPVSEGRRALRVAGNPRWCQGVYKGGTVQQDDVSVSFDVDLPSGGVAGESPCFFAYGGIKITFYYTGAETFEARINHDVARSIGGFRANRWHTFTLDVDWDRSVCRLLQGDSATPVCSFSRNADGGLESDLSLYGNNNAGGCNTGYFDHLRLTRGRRDFALVAHWEFDEISGATAADGSGNGHTGSVLGATWSAGTLAFDGTNDHVEVQDADTLDFGDGVTDRPFSIEFWVMANALPSGTSVGFVAKDASSQRQWAVMGSTPPGGGRAAPEIAVLDNSTGGYRGRYVATTANYLFTGRWYHLAYTYDGSGVNGGFRIYLDGTRVDDSDYSSGEYVAMENTETNVTIGKQGGWGCFFHGSIDDVKIHDYARSAAEIRADYESRIPYTVAVAPGEMPTALSMYDALPNVEDGTISLFGGATDPATYTRDVHVYNIAGDTWTTKKNCLPYALEGRGVFAALGSDGHIYLSPEIGPAIDGRGRHKNVIRYDPRTESATETSISLGDGNIWGVCLVAASNGNLHAFGGWNGSGVTDVRRIDVAGLTATTVAHLTTGGTTTAITANNGKIYTFTTGGARTGKIHIFDPATESVALSTARIPEEIFASADGGVAAWNGVGANGRKIFVYYGKMLVSYDTSTDSVSYELNFVAPDKDIHDARAIVDGTTGTVYIPGGYEMKGGRLKSMIMLTPQQDRR